MYDVVTFGEAMIRLSTRNFKRLEQADCLDIVAGGAEFNVAVACSRLGLKTAWVSRLPENGLGKLCRNTARLHGVITDHIVWAPGDRMGLYFVEFGASPRPNAVLYDRANSAISRIKPGEVDWAAILKGTRHFHTTGITPALSASAAEVTAEALKAAKQAGCQVSYDLNYRAKLWTQEEARKTQEPFMEMVDILATTEEDTKRVFGIEGKDYEEVAVKLQETFNFKAVCITLRENPSVWRNTWSAILYMDGKMYRTRKYDIEVVDRIGSGDSLTGGLLYGLLTHGDPQASLDIAVAFSAIKQTLPGDVIFADLAEAEKLAKGASLRIAR